MLSLFRKRPTGLDDTSWNKYQTVISEIITCLDKNGSTAQAEVMREVLASVISRSEEKFLKKLYTADLWGGSGAVWEIGFQAKDEEEKFQRHIIEFCKLLEVDRISKYSIRGIRKLFERTLTPPNTRLNPTEVSDDELNASTRK
jgi:hypothetical protein